MYTTVTSQRTKIEAVVKLAATMHISVPRVRGLIAMGVDGGVSWQGTGPSISQLSLSPVCHSCNVSLNVGA
jgi:hypothetical protein